MQSRVVGWTGLVVATGAVGCATTGLGWVNEPENGVDLAPPMAPSSVEPRRPPRAAPSATVESGAETARSRPRLDHTVTLGESVSIAPQAPPYDPRVAGVVNVNVYVSPSSAGYGGYGGYFYAAPVGVGVPVGARTMGTSAQLRPGLDWRSPPSFGPAFPYRMGPASPWESDGSRRH